MTKKNKSNATKAAGSKKLAAPATARVKAVKRPQRVSPPAAVSYPNRGSWKAFKSAPAGLACVHGKEYIQLVDCSTLTEFSALPVNPAHEPSFPLLAADAKRFEKYRFTRLRFSFEPTAPTTKAGEVALGLVTNPDITATPLTFLDVLNLGPGRSASGGPWQRHTVAVPKQDLAGWRLVSRSASLAPTQVAADYHIGRFYLCTSGGDNSVVGLLAVEYECEFDGQYVGTGEVPTSLELVKASAPTSVANLQTGMNYNPAMEDLDWSLLSSGSQSYLVPSTTNRGVFEVDLSGTGFDHTTQIVATTKTGDLINMSALEPAPLIGTGGTKAVKRFATTALPNGNARIASGDSNALDWVNFALTGAGTIAAYAISWLKEAYSGGPSFKDYLPPVLSLPFAGLDPGSSSRVHEILSAKKSPRLDHDCHRAISDNVRAVRRRRASDMTSGLEIRLERALADLGPERARAFLKKVKRCSHEVSETPSA